MPLLWDIYLSFVSGFFFSSLKPVVENKLKKEKLNDTRFFLLGLMFNQLVIVLISVWIYTEIDPNWIMLYLINPNMIGNGIHFIYACFPFFYICSYRINKSLYNSKIGRYSLFIVASSWIIFTFTISQNFFIVFKGDDTPTHGIDFSSQFIWNVTSYPDTNILWVVPGDLGQFFLMFFIFVIFLMALFESLAILVAWKDLLKTS